MSQHRKNTSIEELPKEPLFQTFMALDPKGLKAMAQTNKHFAAKVEAFLDSYIGKIWLLQHQFLDLRLERTAVHWRWGSKTGGDSVPSQKENTLRINGDIETLKSQPGLIGYVLKQLDNGEYLDADTVLKELAKLDRRSARGILDFINAHSDDLLKPFYVRDPTPQEYRQKPFDESLYNREMTLEDHLLRLFLKKLMGNHQGTKEEISEQLKEVLEKKPEYKNLRSSFDVYYHSAKSNDDALIETLKENPIVLTLSKIPPSADNQGLDLSYADLSWVKLDQRSLGNNNLQYSDMTGASLSKTNLNGTKLQHTYIAGASCEGTDFRNAQLELCKIVETDIDANTRFDHNIDNAKLEKLCYMRGWGTWDPIAHLNQSANLADLMAVIHVKDHVTVHAAAMLFTPDGYKIFQKKCIELAQKEESISYKDYHTILGLMDIRGGSKFQMFQQNSQKREFMKLVESGKIKVAEPKTVQEEEANFDEQWTKSERRL